MTTYPTKSGYTMTTQKNSTLVPGMAYFNDDCRDGLRGPNSSNTKTGYLGNAGGYASKVRNTFTCSVGWCKSPTQTINYASCHDGLTLYDRITLSTAELTEEQRIRMNNLSAAIILTSQGVPFIHAGEEMLRSKPLGDGKYDHNSYDSPDSVNSFKWNDLNKEEYRMVRDYYSGLAAFRQAHPALRMTTAEEIAEHVTTIYDDLDSNVTAFHISAGANGEENEFMFIFNPRKEDTTVTLPEGNWDVYVSGQTAGTEVLSTETGSVTVEPISAMVLVQAAAEETPTEDVTEPAPGCPPSSPRDSMGIWVGVAVAVVAIAAVVVIVVAVKKRKD
jgi:pullulanase